MAQNALLAGLTSPRLDLVGPTADDDIRRAILRYGADEVTRAFKAATKKKLGRKREPDWRELRPIIEEDARSWLEGKDPFSERSTYAIAKDFAERNPGQSIISTHKRIERKLSRGPHNRVWWTLVTAENLSRDEYSYVQHIRALKALADLPKHGHAFVYSFQRALRTLSDFEAREGYPPPEEMTFSEVENAVQAASQNALSPFARLGGLFGSAASSGQAGGLLASALKLSPSTKE